MIKPDIQDLGRKVVVYDTEQEPLIGTLCLIKPDYCLLAFGANYGLLSFSYEMCFWEGETKPARQITRRYSGYKDCHGAEIMEGDTIKGIGEHVGQSKVFYSEGCWQPFSYLSASDGSEFEIVVTGVQFNTDGN